ncbi:hypothetical protein PIB30_077612 [Stylosanthes scabra]|uniref:Retrotransposon gag domain-containing protein n=1 Tax=Stylosanthes scabra TaxID=79078 RepID=A0ABU6SQZ7_9FABA|nr:hypothetical protein [Stylosanthes scabra]
MEFCNKFLEEEPSMHIMDLGRIKQRQGEGLVAFIKRYRDQTLLCMGTLPAPQLRASDITEEMKRSGRRSRETPSLEVCAADDRSKRRSYSRGSYSKGSNKRSPPLLFPLSRAQAMVVVNGWFEDGTLKPKTDRETPTAEDLRDLKHCMVHWNKNHALTDCYVDTPFPQHGIGMIGVAGEVMLTEIVDEAEGMITSDEFLDKDILVRGLLKSRGC